MSLIMRLTVLFCIQLFVFGSTIKSTLHAQTPKKSYQLVWSDEFSGQGLPDSTKWGYDVGTGSWGWGNNEQQYYTKDSLGNAKVSNGVLTITARNQKMGDKKYTSARLVTRGKAAWTYGKIEVRAKLSKGIGTWPAIWMLGTNIDSAGIGWPQCGEIDIMEHTGSRATKIDASVHTKNFNWPKNTQKTAATHLSDYGDAFHNYQLIWDAQTIIISIDDKPLLTVHNDGTGKNSWPFDDPCYLLLNLAIGGNYAGYEMDEKSFPASMQIDYVRVYQLRTTKN
jgi:beta-glucanase (GH16 family)